MKPPTALALLALVVMGTQCGDIPDAIGTTSSGGGATTPAGGPTRTYTRTVWRKGKRIRVPGQPMRARAK